MENSVVKVNKLALSISAALILGTVGSAQAATKSNTQQQQVADLQAQVVQLQQLVQQLSSQQQQLAGQQSQLSGQQQQQAVQLQQQAIQSLEKPAIAPKEASAKPGWIALADGQTQLKIYGSARVDSTYDFAGSNAATTDVYNRTNKVPLNSANAPKGALNVSAANSRIGLDILRPTSYGDLTAKIEADFMGSSYTNGNGSFRVRHAYMSLDKWLVGQTASPFVNVDTTPEVVDPNGPMGSGSQRTVQVRYTQPITKNQKVLVAVEGGDVDNFSGTSQTSGGGRLPALTARYDIATADKKGLLQVHGLLHENRVATNDSNDKEGLGWGVGVGAKYSLTPNDTLFANYYHAKGDGRYMLYSNSAYVATANGTSYNINPSEFNSALVGYGHKWNSEWRSGLAAGGIWYNDTNAYAKNSGSANKTQYNIILNTFYTPVKNVDIGAEYTYGQRQTFAASTATTSDKGDYSRLNLMAKYSF